MPKIEVNLGLGPETYILPEGELHPDTLQRIDRTLDFIRREKVVTQRLAADKITKEKLQTCLNFLISATARNEKVSADQLKMTTKVNNLSSLILKFRHYLKTNGNVWELKKHSIKGVTHYSIKLL